ncbi:MAG: hypothetical protein WCD36_00090 [Rhodanobacteraceae bacterium]
MYRLTPTRLPALLAGLLLAIIVPAQATTYNVEHDASANTLQLRDADTGNLIASSAAGCCDVMAGALDTDTGTSQLFVLDSTASGQHLVTLTLPGLAPVHDVALAAGASYIGPRFNTSDGLLYALQADSTAGTLGLVTLDPATGAATTVGAAESNCCLVVPGTVALGADNGSLLAVTRPLDDSTLSISTWDIATGNRTVASIPANRHIDALARDPSSHQWLVLYRDDGGTQTLASLTLPGATVTPLATLADCCSTLASTAVFDPGAAALRVAARGDTTGTLRTYAFGTSGSVQAGPTLASSLGLVRSGAVSDVIFADGFEVTQTVAGNSSSGSLMRQMSTPAGMLDQLLKALPKGFGENAGNGPGAAAHGAVGSTPTSQPTPGSSTYGTPVADPAIPVPALGSLALLLLMLTVLAAAALMRPEKR